MPRILVWGLSNNRAGTEEVIANYVRNISNYSFDFLCYDYPINYSDLLKNGENRFFTIPVKIKHPLKFRKSLKEFFLKFADQYCAIWFNANDISNIDVLVYAERYGIPNRILHMHNSQIPKKIITRVFTRLNWHKCDKVINHRWACSESAGKYIFSDRDFVVVPNFVDAQKCMFSEAEREFIRNKYNAKDSFLIGCIGRLANQKNQQYLISLMPDLLSRNGNIKLLLVGDGENRDSLQKLVDKLLITDSVLFVGMQQQVEAFYSAFDAFVLPSLYEGFGIVLLEAQYNGLPCIVSDSVVRDAVISNSVVFCSFQDRKAWIDAILTAQRATFELSDRAKVYNLSNCSEFAQRLFGPFASST